MPATPDVPTAPELPFGDPVTAAGEAASVAVPTGVDDAGSRPATTPTRRSRSSRTASLDAVCLGAVETARAAAAETAGADAVGEHAGVLSEGERVLTHYFECLLRGYRGWRWAVTVSRVPRARAATVSEVVLLPGTGALLPPAWVPWSDRVAPGDLGPHDQLPYRADDPHLEAGYAPAGREAAPNRAADRVDADAAADPAVLPSVADAGDEVVPLLPADDDADRLAVWELGLGRRRVLSAEGREAAAARWYTGEHGPTAETALHASAPCASCGFYLPLAGGLRQMFGVCANAWSPDDGKVVSLDHGCGAHSETDVEQPEPEPLPSLILDETGAEAVVVPLRRPDDAAADAAGPADADAAGPVDAGDTTDTAEAAETPADTPAEPGGDATP